MPPVIIAAAAVVAYSAAYYYIAAALFVASVALASDVDTPEYDNDSVNPLAAQEITTSANQPRKVIYGEAIVGGQIAGYRKIKEGIYEYHYMIINIAGHPCESVEIYEIDGVTPAEFGDAVFSVFHLGDQTEAHPYAVEHVEDWTEDHVGFGLTNAYLRVRIDPEVFPNGINQFKFKVKGKRIYDPRLDSTMGGTGLQRANDESTWEWSDNATLCNYDYIRFHGYRPIPARRIPWDFVALTANYCDELVEYVDVDDVTQTEPRFTCNGVLNNTLKPGDSLKYLLSTCGAKIYRPNGQIYIKPAMYGGPSTVTLTPNDFVVQPTYQPSRPENARYNVVRADYVEPELKYQVTGAPVVTSATYVARDGVELDAQLKLYLTNRSTMAQRLAKRYLERSNAGFTSEFVLAGIRLDIAPGLVVEYVDPETGIDREFIVQSYRVNVEKKQTILSVEEESIEIYIDDALADIVLPPNSSLPDTTNVLPVEDITFTATLDDTFRQGYLKWNHPVPSSIVSYKVVIDGPNDFSRDFYPIAPTQDLTSLDVGEYSVTISAKNRWNKCSLTSALQFNIALPSVPIVSVNAITDDSVTLSASVGGQPSLATTFFWQFLGTDENVVSGKVVKGDIYTYTGLSPEVTYNFRCQTVNVAGKSTWIELAVTTLAASASVSNVRFDQLDENLASLISTLDRNYPIIRSELTDEQARTIAQIANEAKAEIAQQVTNVKVENAESNIVRIDAVSATSATAIQQINSSVNGIYARATNFTRTAVGYWNGSTWIEGPISEDIRELRVDTANGGFAKFSEIGQVFVNKDGNLVARGAMLTDANGLLSGFVNHNDGSTGQFDILATDFRVGVWDASASAMKPYLYLNNNQMILENSWLLGETLQVGAGGISYVGGKPIFNNQNRVAIGQFFSDQAVVVANASNVAAAALRSNGRHTFVRGSSQPALTIESTNASYSGGTSIKSESTTGIADFADGVAQFTAKHPYLVPLNFGEDPVGKLCVETDVYNHFDINNALSFAEISTQPRSCGAVGVFAQRKKLMSEVEETIAGLTLAEENALKPNNAIGYMNVLGDGLMWVCSEAGDIGKYKWLCSSSTRGHAMLQTEVTGEYIRDCVDFTVAKSRETVIWANEPHDTKLIAVYYKGG